MAELSHKEAFQTVDRLVKSWSLGEYVHHVRYVKDQDQGQEFVVIFSKPQPTKPVPELVVNATFLVRPPRFEGDMPQVSYTIESQKQKLSGQRPIRLQWLDAAMRRKEMMASASAGFAKTGKLPEPLAFVPGKYKALEALEQEATEQANCNEERFCLAAANVEVAHEIADRNVLESDADLEQLLVTIFREGDVNRDGYLDSHEFCEILQTSQLGFSKTEAMGLLTFADANGDGKIEYHEFAPVGADIVQTMRLRQLHAAETEVLEQDAELRARATIHNLGPEAIHNEFLAVFRACDADGSGRLEREEIEHCLQSLTLGNTKLTPREIAMVLACVDEDGSGTIEYNEFAPLMYECLVGALKLGFLQSESSNIVDYLREHLASYDASRTGRLPLRVLKTALSDADVLGLTPVQRRALLAEAPVSASDGTVGISDFALPAARLAAKMLDPTLGHRRAAIEARAKHTPLGVLTVAERARLEEMAAAVFAQYDADGSGKLDRFELHKCLVECNLGLSDRQVTALMAHADGDDDGLVDYAEFARLFHTTLLELQRHVAIERELDGELDGEDAATVQAHMSHFLDELMVPLCLAFDLRAGGADALPPAEVVDILRTKREEWGVLPEAADLIAAAVMQHAEALMPWPALVAIIERLALATDEATGEPASGEQ